MLGVAAIIVASLLFNLNLLVEQLVNYNRHKVNSIVLLEEKYRDIKSMLPKNGIVSYISDASPTKKIKRYQQFYLQRYYLSQYILSPLIIVRNSDCPLVIGDFNSNVSLSGPQFHDLVLLKNNGNGLMLFERRSK
ncbi:MAG: hypothetical protein NTZ48_05405 [Candidatus Omnitrophica bacterium]|nr:hypothetical protein [Candidatus Omnitrophota bacterium]